MKYEDMFKYNQGVVPDGVIRVSPSSIKDLIKNRPFWIKSNVLKIRKQDDMTNANIGTVLHAMIEGTYKGLYEEEILEAGLSYFEFTNSWRVSEMLKIMYSQWKETYYLTDREVKQNETWLEYQPNDKVILSGTCDRISDGVIIDYKSSGSKISSIDSYRGQLYLYAWIARKMGMDIHSVRVVGVPRPRWSDKTEKFGVCSVTSITEPIDEEYMSKLITDVKDAIQDIIQACDSQEILNWIKSTEILNPYDRSDV